MQAAAYGRLSVLSRQLEQTERELPTELIREVNLVSSEISLLL